MEKTMKLWNMIKPYWKWLVGGILGLVAIISAIGSLFTKHTNRKIQEKIDRNDRKLNRVKGQEDQIKRQTRQVKSELIDLKETVKQTKTTKRKPAQKKEKKTSTAKKNIVSKTKRTK